jgi:hypothetical protein
MKASFLSRDTIYKCTMKAKEEPEVLVLIIDSINTDYSREYLLLAPDSPSLPCITASMGCVKTSD